MNATGQILEEKEETNILSWYSRIKIINYPTNQSIEGNQTTTKIDNTKLRKINIFKKKTKKGKKNPQEDPQIQHMILKAHSTKSMVWSQWFQSGPNTPL